MTTSIHEYRKRLYRVPKHQRPGQWAYNLLDELRPDLGQRVVATDLDPFHISGRLSEFLSWVEEHWDDPITEERKACARY